MRSRRLVLCLVGCLMWCGACGGGGNDGDASKDDSDDATTSTTGVVDTLSKEDVEKLVHDLAVEHGTKHFQTAGHQLEGDLECEVKSTRRSEVVELECTGTTLDEREAGMSGATTQTPVTGVTELLGDFTGTLDDIPVFTTARLGIAADGSG